MKTKRKRSDSVLWQNPQHQRKIKQNSICIVNIHTCLTVVCIELFFTTVTQPTMQLPFQMFPSVNRINQGATSLPFSASQPLIALPFTQRNQAVAQLPQGQMWHSGLSYTQPAPTLQTFPQQNVIFYTRYSPFVRRCFNIGTITAH